MEKQPEVAYVYQPLHPQPDGRFYGVAGLESFGMSFNDSDIRGVTKSDAETIAMYCNSEPEKANSFIRFVKQRIENEWSPDCGCRFESLFSNSVLLCEKCSELPCHNK